VAPPTCGFEAFLHHGKVEAEPGKHRRGRSVVPQETKENVLGSDRVMPETNRLRPSALQGTLSLGAQRMRIHSGCWGLTQSGLASSISMMGIPSSTG
jgi:hypothetical protein